MASNFSPPTVAISSMRSLFDLIHSFAFMRASFQRSNTGRVTVIRMLLMLSFMVPI